jgi:hypothetical protein
METDKFTEVLKAVRELSKEMMSAQWDYPAPNPTYPLPSLARKISVIERFLESECPAWKQNGWDKLEAAEAFQDKHDFEVRVEAYYQKYPDRRPLKKTRTESAQ